MSLVKLDVNLNKEVCTMKLNSAYHGVIVGQESLYITDESFDSPLKAANFARQLKRTNKIDINIKKNQQSPKLKFQTKLLKVCKLYTETEMAGMTNLRFRETWVILSPSGKYVKSVLKENKVAEYSDDRENAMLFKTYEEARMKQNTLNMVLKQGHCLRRFFIETK
jgi:hypothetical protein